MGPPSGARDVNMHQQWHPRMCALLHTDRPTHLLLLTEGIHALVLSTPCLAGRRRAQHHRRLKRVAGLCGDARRLPLPLLCLAPLPHLRVQGGRVHLRRGAGRPWGRGQRGWAAWQSTAAHVAHAPAGSPLSSSAAHSAFVQAALDREAVLSAWSWL